MSDLIRTITYVQHTALDRTLRNLLGSRMDSSSVWYDEGKMAVHFVDEYTGEEEAIALATIAAHDPVFITAIRTGSDVMVTLSKPLNLDSAAELTLTIDGEAAPEATALTDNAAAVEIESADAITIGIVEDYPYLEVTI